MTQGIPTPATTEKFEGVISDPAIIESFQERRFDSVALGARIRRLADNARLLGGNVTRPEKDIPVRPRRLLQRGYKSAVFVVLVLALGGLWALRRHRAAGLLVYAQLATIVIVAALYLGEARYRVP